MKRFIVGLLILGSAIALIALVVRRRSGSGVDEWDSFADDTFSRASTSATKISDAASQVSETVEEAASDGSEAVTEAASDVSEAAKKA